jgi:elongation factor G
MAKSHSPAEIRNVALISHYGAGKTSLGEAMLYVSGTTKRLGSVDNGTSTSDYDPSEIDRHMSIYLSVLSQEWKGTKVNILDTPGYVDFVGEVKSGLRVADAALIVVGASEGVEVGTEQVWELAGESGLARFVFVNKMDRENADFSKVVQQLQERLGPSCLAIQLPIGAAGSFEGYVDLVRMKAHDGDGQEMELPSSLADEARSHRERLVEAVVESDDDLLTRYLEGEEIRVEEISKAMRQAVCSGGLVPVLVGSALRNVGVSALLDAVCDYAPSPEELGAARATSPGSGGEEEVWPDVKGPLAALVFKTSADPFTGKISYFRVYSGTLAGSSQVLNANKNSGERVGQLFAPLGKQQQSVGEVGVGDIGAVTKLGVTSTGDTLCSQEHPVVLEGIGFPVANFSMAVQPMSKGDVDKMSTVLPRICEEDPSLNVHQDQDTNEIIVSGVGDSHLEMVKERLRRKFGVEVQLSPPKAPYKETITVATKAEYKHRKQTGGHGQYGHVFLEVEPLARGEGFQFATRIVGGAIPSNYIPSVEKGVNEARQEGVLAKYPVVDMKVTLYDGSFHPVDSSDIAFKIAGAQALRRGLQEAKPVLLEPVMNLSIMVPESLIGDVIGDLNTKRGRVVGMAPQDGASMITAQAPYAELLRYAIDLRSITQGRGTFTMEFSHYEQVPPHISQKIIGEAKAAGKE